MGQPSNEKYDGADRSIREPYQMTNVERLIRALRRQPGITEITLATVFAPGNFFTFTGITATPLSWTYRIPEVIREALTRGLIRAVPTSHPDYTAYYAIEATDPEYGIEVTA